DEISKQLDSAQAAKLRLAIRRLEFHSVSLVASRFKTMISDISGQLGKRVNFSVSGEALLSPSKIAPLQECVLHLVRNSIDHGIERPEDRVRSGKPEIGSLNILLEDGLT